MLAQLNATSSVLDIARSLDVVGIGQGLFSSPNSNTLWRARLAAEQGQASGLQATGRVVGQSLSVAVAGATFASLGGAAAGATLIGVRPSVGAAPPAGAQLAFVDAFRA